MRCPNNPSNSIFPCPQNDFQLQTDLYPQRWLHEVTPVPSSALAMGRERHSLHLLPTNINCLRSGRFRALTRHLRLPLPVATVHLKFAPFSLAKSTLDAEFWALTTRFLGRFLISCRLVSVCHVGHVSNDVLAIKTEVK